jgi:radical SAM superfamily enzyme YgiQ (UPF0313 family)
MTDGVSPVVIHRGTRGSSPSAPANTIALCTLNAKYIHSSLGLRYLLANLDQLQTAATLQEFTINQRATDIVETLLDLKPEIIGFGVYIWNIQQTTEVIQLIKAVAPSITLIIGGPEVSYEYEDTAIFASCDYLITGQADIAFKTLCEDIIGNRTPAEKVIAAIPPPPTSLNPPYDNYNDEDIANRILYVEASRGCPFKCEFCLSALDKTATPFELPAFLSHMNDLYQRGARQFKFVDRTFNLKTDTCIAILDFFLARLDDQLFVHFEVIPDKLPAALKSALSRFPAGVLQFEVGIQSFNSTVQQTINRKQHAEKTLSNLAWLRNHTQAYIHADLIAGLPGESLESFASGFNQLAALRPHEIQVGILKRLRGTSIIRHTEGYAMRYSPVAPYQLLSNRDLDFATMQKLQRFARYWDLIANSSRFNHCLPLILGETPFESFWQLSAWIHSHYQQTHKISQKRLFEMIYQGARALSLCPEANLLEALTTDYDYSGEKGKPPWLQQRSERNATPTSHAKRQARQAGTPAASQQ